MKLLARIHATVFPLLAAVALVLLSPSASANKEREARERELRSFQHIVFDTRGSRGGHGDVAASYLTALDFLDRMKYPRPITLLVDDDSEAILSTLVGRPVAGGNAVHAGMIRLATIKQLVKKPPADLFLQLASPNADFAAKGETMRGVFGGDPKIRLAPNAVVTTQVVFGGSEAWRNENRTGSFRFGSETFAWSSAGFGETESGVYGDSVAAHYANLDAKARREELFAALRAQKPEAADRIRSVLNGAALAGAEPSTVYGIWQDVQQETFASYLDGITRANITSDPKRSFVFFSPLEFDIENAPKSIRDSIIVLEKDAKLPKQAVPGKIYIMQTGKLPHEVFVGLLANSRIPPVVAGDSAVSAMVALREPFVMTKVDWNAPNIENLGHRLRRSMGETDEDGPIRRSFPLEKGGLPDHTDALAFERPGTRAAFAQALGDVPLLSDQLLDGVAIARAVQSGTAGHREVAAAAAFDNKLQESLMRKLARTNAEAWLWLDDPESWAALFGSGNPSVTSDTYHEALSKLIEVSLRKHKVALPVVARAFEEQLMRPDLTFDQIVASAARIHSRYPALDLSAILLGGAARKWRDLPPSRRESLIALSAIEMSRKFRDQFAAAAFAVTGKEGAWEDAYRAYANASPEFRGNWGNIGAITVTQDPVMARGLRPLIHACRTWFSAVSRASTAPASP